MRAERIDIFKEIVIVLFLSLFLISALSMKTVNAQTDRRVTLKPTDDTYVDPIDPTSNYGGQNYLELTNWEGYNTTTPYSVWLKFDLSTIPKTATVDTATLQLYTSFVSETCNINANSCSDNSWTELTLTYSNMPNYNTSPIDSAIVATNSKWYSWNVVDSVRNALNSNLKTMTIVLSQPLPQGSLPYITFYSKENPVYFGEDYSPKLTIHWSQVVPEFPISIMLPLFMITTLLVTVAFRKRHINTEPKMF